jgi:hypothetical protein
VIVFHRNEKRTQPAARVNPSSAVGAGSENSFRGERFFQRGGLRGKLIFWSDVVPNTPL